MYYLLCIFSELAVEFMKKMKVAVIGSGVSGLAAAYVLAKGGAQVAVYEKEDYLGGHARTVTVDGTSLDLGFMVFNRVSTYDDDESVVAIFLLHCQVLVLSLISLLHFHFAAFEF